LPLNDDNDLQYEFSSDAVDDALLSPAQVEARRLTTVQRGGVAGG